jgi:hypothetical protein
VCCIDDRHPIFDLSGNE